MQENIAVISLKNIKSNFSAFGRLFPRGVKTYAVVKANAYGHGMERVAECIQNYTDGLVVTSIREGIILRSSGSYQPVLALTPPLDMDDVYLAFYHNLTLTIPSFAALKVVSSAAEKFSITPSVHIKIDTGMNRLGLRGKNAVALFAALKKARAVGVAVTGIYSHLFASENREQSVKQRNEFARMAEIAQDIMGERLHRHLSATGGAILGIAGEEDFFFDGVRLGIGLYGYLPSGMQSVAKTAGVCLRPAMKLYTHNLGAHLFTGDGAGYAVAARSYGHFTAYRLGYADGFSRVQSGGGNLNAVGNLCMDSCIVERNEKRKYGGKKLVFSSVDDLSRKCQTIPYEILCNATKRADLIYVE